MKTTPSVRSLVVLATVTGALLFAVAGCATHESPATMQATAGTAATGAYPLKTCVVSGEDLGKEPYVFTSNGQTVKLCCKDCLEKFNAEPGKYLTKIAQAK
jgi:YHS domain-containing protein